LSFGRAQGPLAATFSADIVPPKTAINEIYFEPTVEPLFPLCCLSLLMTTLSQLLGKEGLNYMARLQSLLRNLGPQ
jgi:hypothetical protein